MTEKFFTRARQRNNALCGPDDGSAMFSAERTVPHSPRSRRPGLSFLCLGLLAAALAAPLATLQAAPVSVTWTGTVVQANFDTALVGETITGAFTFDADGVPVTVSSVGGGAQAFYSTDHVSSFAFAGFSGQKTGQRISMSNDVNGFDQFASRGFSGVYSGDLINGQEVDQIFVPFTDGTGSVFSDTSIPASLNPADINFSILGVLNMGVLGFDDDVRFRVDSFNYTPVAAIPLPAGAWLLLSGLGLVALQKRRQGRRAQSA